MQRLSRDELLKLDRLRKNRLEKKLERRDRISGKDDYKPTLIVAPDVLSFSRNGEQTIRFFEALKMAIFSGKISRRRGRVLRSHFGIDLVPVKSISVPTAVVLAAELHRWSLTLSRRNNLRPKRVGSWSPRVRALLHDLGVFELLDMRVKRSKGDESEEVILLRLQSGEKRDGASVARLQSSLKNLGVVFDYKTYVFGALDEAILNCIDHGYAETGKTPRFPYAGHRWWATSCYDPNNDTLRFFVYDQGIGIPDSLPMNDDFWPSLQVFLSRISGGATESNIIEGAFEVGRTRTEKRERGKGLDKMHAAIRSAGDGHLRVVSGKGDIALGVSGTLKKQDHKRHIGGTLVEWSIPVAALRNRGVANA